ncbi:hypothetical protein [Acidithiobacillus ferridurans]|uniref:hypothetical protein n=1 Tax=Acidithiobacillus ferridurans TaxID=1232575 RepID=UPI0015EF59A3|nr:hypothetical protein [Acidithiobacillus ferridurans]
MAKKGDVGMWSREAAAERIYQESDRGRGTMRSQTIISSRKTHSSAGETPKV